MPNQNHKTLNPVAGGVIFGYVPSIESAGIDSGPIYLPYGRHIRPGNGFGLIHIWLGHQNDIKPLGYNSQEDVARYILDIIQPKSKIFDEGEISSNPKVTILRSRKGICILQNRGDWTRGIDTFYTVTTAYPKENPHGSLVGQMGADCMAVVTEADR
jgi:hypothetical protein